MQHNITNMEDIRAFIEQIAGEIDNFHLLTDFRDYVHPDSFFRRYTDEEATIRNKALDQCIRVCDMRIESSCEYLLWYDINISKVKVEED